MISQQYRECIHPWLTERQGCCPFCKTEVFEDTNGINNNESTTDSAITPAAVVGSNATPAVVVGSNAPAAVVGITVENTTTNETILAQGSAAVEEEGQRQLPQEEQMGERVNV